MSTILSQWVYQSFYTINTDPTDFGTYMIAFARFDFQVTPDTSATVPGDAVWSGPLLGNNLDPNSFVTVDHGQFVNWNISSTSALDARHDPFVPGITVPAILQTSPGMDRVQLGDNFAMTTVPGTWTCQTACYVPVPVPEAGTGLSAVAAVLALGIILLARRAVPSEMSCVPGRGRGLCRDAPLIRL
jgi:hypothetical protein